MAVSLNRTVVLLCLGALFCKVPTIVAEDRQEIRRVVNPAGWTFPGQQGMAGRRASPTTRGRIDGTAVEISTFSDLPIWNERERRYLTNRVVFVYSSGDSVTIHERDLVANEVSRYSVGTRPFLYTMLAYPCMMDAKTKEGGCAGADIKLAYYDEDGDGKFELMEIVNAVLSPDDSRNWHPRIPSWAIAFHQGH